MQGHAPNHAVLGIQARLPGSLHNQSGMDVIWMIRSYITTSDINALHNL